MKCFFYFYADNQTVLVIELESLFRMGFNVTLKMRLSDRTIKDDEPIFMLLKLVLNHICLAQTRNALLRTFS